MAALSSYGQSQRPRCLQLRGRRCDGAMPSPVRHVSSSGCRNQSKRRVSLRSAAEGSSAAAVAAASGSSSQAVVVVQRPLPSSAPAPADAASQSDSLMSPPHGGALSSSNSSSSRTPAARSPDSVLRSAAKALLWRLFSTSATVAIAVLIFHDTIKVEDALKLGGLDFCVKFCLYFIHERLWAAL